MTADQFDYPMGPKLREWLGLVDTDKRDASQEERAQFTEFFIDFVQNNKVKDQDQLVDIMDELLSMDLPLLVLKLADSYPEVWKGDDYRGLRAEGLAAQISGEFARAQEAFFKAHELNKEELAPYVNLAQIFTQSGYNKEAKDWIFAGLKVDPQYHRLWEVLGYIIQQESANAHLDIAKFSRQYQSWVGASLAAEMDPTANQFTKVNALKPFFDKGERSVDFLTEYTGALGAAGDFDQIPVIVWQAKKYNSKTIPWKLQLHSAQAYLAAEKLDEFKAEAKILEGYQDLPAEIRAQLQQAMEYDSSEQAPH